MSNHNNPICLINEEVEEGKFEDFRLANTNASSNENCISKDMGGLIQKEKEIVLRENKGNLYAQKKINDIVNSLRKIKIFDVCGGVKKMKKNKKNKKNVNEKK